MPRLAAVPPAVVVLLLSACASGPAAPPPRPTPSSTTAAAVAAAMRGKQPVIAFQSGGRVRVAALDAAAGAPIAPDIDAGDQVHPDWSPDGTRIVFRADDADGTQDIWIAGLDGAAATRLFDCVDPCVFSDDPAWRPDGRAVLFERGTRTGADTGRFELVVRDVASRDEQVVLTMTGSESPYRSRWSGDGRRIVKEIDRWASGAVDEDRQLGSRIAVVDVASRSVRDLADDGFEPDWHPGADRIVFTRDLETGWELFTVQASGGAPVRLTHKGDDGGRALQGSWSPDGSRLVAVWEDVPGAEHSRAAILDPATGQATVVSAFPATHPRLRPGR